MDKILFIMAVMASGIASPRPVNPDSIKTKTSKLGEIVVEASMQRTGAGVSTYYPDRNSRRTALNAIDLLNRMAIPQINVDPLGGSVRTPGGEDVAVFIDMEPATPEEKDALRAEDVKKVEYFVFPSDPRFNHERYVINITLRHYEYGGYSKLSATGNIMAGSESGLAYAKMSYKRMTYDVNVTDKYTDRRNTGTERTQVFRFPSEDGKTEEITRSDILDYSRFRENQLGASVRAKYASDMAVISNSVYFTARNTPNSDTRGTLRLSTDLTGDKSYSNTCNSTYLYPRWVGNYYFNFGNDLKLNAIPSLFYQYTRSHRGYSSGETSILTDATEKAITGQLQFQISKTLHKYHSLNLNLMGLYYHNRVDYSGNTEASPVFRQFAYGGILSYSLGMERLYGQLAVAFAGESNKISGVTTNSLIPMCRLNMQYAFNQKNSISLTARYDVKAVGAADKTPDIIQENELLYKVGNVNLRNTHWAKATADYTCLLSDRFTISLFSGWRRFFNHLVPVFYPQGPDGGMLRTIENNGDYQDIYAGTSITARLLNRRLVVKATPQMWFERLSGLYSGHTDYPSISLDATYYIGKLYCSAFFTTPHGKLAEYSLNETYIKRKPTYRFIIGWSNGIWNFRAAAVNIFRRSWISSTSSLQSRWFDQHSTEYSAESHQFVSLTASCTFGFGKKVKHGDEVRTMDAGSSAIMK